MELLNTGSTTATLAGMAAMFDHGQRPHNGAAPVPAPKGTPISNKAMGIWEAGLIDAYGWWNDTVLETREVPLRNAPESAPATARTWLTAQAQADLWRTQRRENDSPDARKNLEGWERIRDAAETAAVDEIAAIAAAVNAQLITHRATQPTHIHRKSPSWH